MSLRGQTQVSRSPIIREAPQRLYRLT